jgi:predicted transcriptional regulator
MDKTEMVDLVGGGMRALAPIYDEELGQICEETGVERGDFFLVWLAHKLEPEPLSVEHFRRLSPYNPEESASQRLADLAGKGLLEQAAQGEYRLTEETRPKVKRVLEEGVYAPLTTAEPPLPQQDLERLLDLLRRVVESSVAAPEPAAKFCLLQSRASDPGEGSSTLVRIDQYLTDLVLFRDDAHMGAWQGHNVSGPAWEALGFLWEEQEMSALKERFEARNHPEGGLEQALQELVQLGWTEQDGQSYRITAEGRQLRQAAEEETNRLHFAPWSCLDKTELGELRGLLKAFNDSLSVAEETEA